MDDDIFREHVIRAARDISLYCKDRLRNIDGKCDGCPFCRESETIENCSYCVLFVSGTAPMNWDLEGIAN